MADYKEIYDRMEFNKSYSAKQLGVYPASLTAMAKRGMVKRLPTSPATYVKLDNTLGLILDAVKNYPDAEFFILFKRGKELGMLCREKNGAVLDAFDKVYDLTDVYKMRIARKEICFK